MPVPVCNFTCIQQLTVQPARSLQRVWQRHQGLARLGQPVLGRPMNHCRHFGICEKVKIPQFSVNQGTMGSEIRTNPEFEVKKRLVCTWSRFQMGTEIWKPKHLKSEQMAGILSKIM